MHSVIAWGSSQQTWKSHGATPAGCGGTSIKSKPFIANQINSENLHEGTTEHMSAFLVKEFK